MKDITRLNTEELMDLLLEIAPDAAEIFGDEEILFTLEDKYTPKDIQEFKNQGLNEKQIMLKAKSKGIKNMTKIITLAIKKHREGIYNILACFYEVTPEEISKQKISETIKQLEMLLKNKEVMGFFQSQVD